MNPASAGMAMRGPVGNQPTGVPGSSAPISHMQAPLQSQHQQQQQQQQLGPNRPMQQPGGGGSVPGMPQQFGASMMSMRSQSVPGQGQPQPHHLPSGAPPPHYTSASFAASHANAPTPQGMNPLGAHSVSPQYAQSFFADLINRYPAIKEQALELYNRKDISLELKLQQANVLLTSASKSGPPLKPAQQSMYHIPTGNSSSKMDK